MSEVVEPVARAIHEAFRASLPESGDKDVLFAAARAAISAHNAALAEAGLVIVPREPTEAMSDAALQIEAVGHSHSRRALIEASWHAMIAAALISERGAKE